MKPSRKPHGLKDYSNGFGAIGDVITFDFLLLPRDFIFSFALRDGCLVASCRLRGCYKRCSSA